MTLTAHRLRKHLTYNRASGNFFWKCPTSHRVRVGSRAGTLNSEGYRVIQISGTKHKASRLAVLFETGRMPSGEVTFLNGDRGDCRWRNLKVA